MEWLKCKADCLYFLHAYGHVKDEQLGIIPFSTPSYLCGIIDLFQTERFLVILKARQMFITTAVAGYATWLVMFREGATVYSLSKDQTAANKLIDKCHTIWEYLPDFLRLRLGKDNSDTITFPSLHSEIVSLPATEDAGRMTGATLVVTDEHEFHPHAEKNFSAIFPTITGGGQFFSLSTADKTKIDTFFKGLYIGAKLGKNQFKPVFLPWDLRPGRDEEWLKSATTNMADWQKEQEFPKTEQDALTSLKTRMFFSAEALDTFGNNVRVQSVRHDLVDKYKGVVRLFQLPVVGKRYVLFTDPSDGKDDPHAIIVLDGVTGEEVAESHGKTTADVCASIHNDLVRLYNNAFNSYERNTRSGGIVGTKLDELGTPNQAGFLNVKNRKLDNSKRGWHTSAQLWDMIIWALEESVRTYSITLRSKEAIDEFRQFIVPEGEEPQKVRGGHDDYIDAFARASFLRRYMPAVLSSHTTSFKYQETY